MGMPRQPAGCGPGGFSEAGPQIVGPRSAEGAGRVCPAPWAEVGYGNCQPLSLAVEHEEAWSNLGRQSEGFPRQALQTRSFRTLGSYRWQAW